MKVALESDHFEEEERPGINNIISYVPIYGFAGFKFDVCPTTIIVSLAVLSACFPSRHCVHHR